MDIENKGQCRLFGNVGIIVQIILGAVSFMVLVLKRILEQPKRTWKVWTLVSAEFAHDVRTLRSKHFQLFWPTS